MISKILVFPFWVVLSIFALYKHMYVEAFKDTDEDWWESQW